MCSARRRKRSWRRGTMATRCAAAASVGTASPSSRRCPKHNGDCVQEKQIHCNPKKKRSFSGDYFERISTGFGDCTLKRVESQREGGGNKPKGHGFLLPMIEKSSQNLGPGIMNMDMNMLPQLIGEETLNKSDSRTRSEKETGQMTIFYAGQVIVMDNFPADKAKEVMMFASKSSATFALPPMAQKPAESATGCLNILWNICMSEKELGQMTIFYAGQVIVMDDFSTDKANEVMMLASKSSAILCSATYGSETSRSATGSPNIVLTNCEENFTSSVLGEEKR
ncbi:protein tify 10a [Phtheirospermum japonicum]|uniref:Protein TIFY n=1 Tax=Phtheirospermum japonicum TaxID=374723 RepID=A0A830B092_9LAMI|nr:protein tify 10a [Phtheirospermum japonicum]